MQQLPNKKGFAIDARPPRWDFEAVKATNLLFGKTTVRNVLQKYKRAHVTLEALAADILEYDIKRKPRLQDDKVYVACLESVRQEFVPQVPVIPLTMGAVTTASSVPKDKSPGLPWKDRGYKTKQSVMEDSQAMKEIRTEWILIGKGYHKTLPDCLSFARAQLSSRDGPDKVRGTWGYPTSVFIEEARYVYPYLDFLKKRRDDYPLAYGIEIGLGGMGYINDMFHRVGTFATAIMMDWNRFDKYIPAWVIRDAFMILFECFDLSKVVDSEGYIWPVNPEITKLRWKKMVNYFINTPIRLPDGRRYMKNGGVPSGSCFTNIIDSIVNAIITRYCVFNVTGKMPLYDMFMGDDSVIVTDVPVNLTAIADHAREKFGLEINTKKSYTTTNPNNIQFLGYFNNDGYPVRDMDFLLGSFMLPERNNGFNPLLTACRAVGQMWSTFNAQAALRWYEVVAYLEQEYSLPVDWFPKYMEEYPNRLKFLRLHGLDATKFPVPSRFHEFNAPMAPPRNTYKRRPVRRKSDLSLLYQQFLDNPPPDVEFAVD